MTARKRIDNLVPQSPEVREVDDSDTEVNEGSSLLGAGTQSDYDEAARAPRKGSWNGFEDFEGLPWWKTPSVNWLLIPYALFALAFGGIIVPKLNLILSLVCQRYFADQTLLDPNFAKVPPVALGSDNPQCNIPAVQRDAATFMLVMNLCTGLLSAFVAPMLGHMSDRYGRRRLLAVASLGGLLSELVTIICAKFPQAVDYRWLVLGSIFDGLTGSFTAGSILAQAYASDCTPPSKRAVTIGYLHACLFSGLAFGPILAAYFVEWTGSLLSIFYVVLGCHTFFIVFIAFVMPESVSKKRRKAAQEKWKEERDSRNESAAHRRSHWLWAMSAVNPFAPLKSLWPTGPGTSPRLRINLVALAINDFVVLGCAMAVGQVLLLYTEFMFGWGNLETSRYVSAVSMVRVVTLMGLLPAVNYFFRVRPARRRSVATGVVMVDRNTGADRLDIWLLRLALVSEIVGCVVFIGARHEALFFGGGMFTAFGGLGSATIQAALTKHVPAERVGQLLGAVGMLHAFAKVVGPFLFNGLYAITVGSFPQAIFILLIGLFIIAFLASFAIRPFVHWDEDGEDEPEPANPAAQAFHSDNDRIPLDEDQVLIR